MMEMLFVLMMIAMLCSLFVRFESCGVLLKQTMLQIQSKCHQAQFATMQDGVRREVVIQSHQAIIADETISFPHHMSCTTLAFSYNAKGNISKAGSTVCSLKQSQKKLVFQLGSGRSDIR